MAVWGGLTNSCEKKKSEKQRRKGKKYPFDGEGNGTTLQYSCLENPMDGGAWWAAVHGVAKSRTRLSDFTFTFHFQALEKEMATHSFPRASIDINEPIYKQLLTSTENKTQFHSKHSVIIYMTT